MAAPILINVFPPNAFIVQSADGSAYDLLSANVSTGVVTSAYLPSSATSFLTARLQYLLTLLPSLSSTALKALIRNLVTLEALEGAYTATVTPTGSNYVLGLSGLTTPNNLQVSIPFSMSSPFISPGLTQGQVATAIATGGSSINTAVNTEIYANSPWDSIVYGTATTTDNVTWVTMFTIAGWSASMLKTMLVIMMAKRVPQPNLPSTPDTRANCDCATYATPFNSPTPISIGANAPWTRGSAGTVRWQIVGDTVEYQVKGNAGVTINWSGSMQLKDL